MYTGGMIIIIIIIGARTASVAMNAVGTASNDQR